MSFSTVATVARAAARGAAVALILSAGLAHAAPPGGTVEGVARDAAQHPLAGVGLRLEGPDHKAIARTTSDKDGSYRFANVPPGTWHLVAEKAGVSASADATVSADAGATADLTLLAAAEQPQEEVTVTAQRLEAARIGIEPQVGASTYSFSNEAIQNLPGGENAPLNQVLLQAPGVDQDNLANGGIHIRNEHLEVQYRINGIILPEGVSFFGQGLTPRFINSMQLITGTLPAEYGLRTAGIVDIQTKSGIFQPGGALDMYGGSYGQLHPSAEYGGTVNGFNYFVAGDYLQDSHGIDAVTAKYNQIHDDTQQLHGFGYVDKIVDSSSKVAVIAGGFNGQFQIPNNPGQPVNFTPVDGLAGYQSGQLTEHQIENSDFAIVSYLRSEEYLDFQVSAFTKYSSLHFHPDSLGDIFFDGIAQDALRRSFANGVQGDGSMKLGADHTLRGGFLLNEERASADTTSSVLPIVGCSAGTVADGCAGGVAAYGAAPISIADNSAKTGWSYSAYLQDEWHVLPSVTVNYGARFDVINAYTMENQISPRLNTVWKPTDATTVHAGYANYFTPPPFELVSTKSLNQFISTSSSCAQSGPGTSETGTCSNSPVKAERSHVFDAGVTQEVLPGLKVGLDAYYKYARNLLDEGQFGAPVVLTPFNYSVGYNKGVELTTSYTKGAFNYYGNLAIGEEKGEGISSAQFNFSPADLAYISSHSINTDHSQRMTASAGMSYLWQGTRYGIDIIAGTGLRTTTATGAPNEETVPSYEQVNLSVSHTFDMPYGGPLELRADIVNLLDEIYLIRSQTGVGVFAPAYGPRRTVFLGVRKEF